MKELKLFIWQGKGISDAYHDDGTLVVLAHTAEEARKIMLDDKLEADRQSKARWDEWTEAGKALGYSEPFYWRQAHPKAAQAKLDELNAKYTHQQADTGWDGSEKAINRKPDQVIELDGPKFVAFNGGGYD